jgi:hypothetical protein
LVVLVLLSQTAACLLHYGIRVAHMFLQHGLQRLPSVVDACRPALAALAAASDTLERVPAAAGSSARPLPAAGEHPKLARLRELVLQLKSAKPVRIGSCPCSASQQPACCARPTCAQLHAAVLASKFTEVLFCWVWCCLFLCFSTGLQAAACG